MNLSIYHHNYITSQCLELTFPWNIIQLARARDGCQCHFPPYHKLKLPRQVSSAGILQAKSEKLITFVDSTITSPQSSLSVKRSSLQSRQNGNLDIHDSAERYLRPGQPHISCLHCNYLQCCSQIVFYPPSPKNPGERRLNVKKY